MPRKTLRRAQAACRPNSAAPFEPQLLPKEGTTCRSIHTPSVHTSDVKRTTVGSGQ